MTKIGNNPIGEAGSVDYTGRIPKFGGIVYYVSKLGDNSNDGLSPESPLLSIGAAMGKVAEGDAINIMAGGYNEIGLDLDINYCELWFEIGVTIDPDNGTALIISGNSCKIQGNHIISPASGEIGLLVSGNYCRISDGRVQQGGTGIKITGQGAIINDYVCGDQTLIGFDIQGNSTRINDCSTVGSGTTYGFKINNNSNTGVLKNCTSVGHGTHGYYIGSGSSNWTVLDCSSGRGDGVARDIDETNIFNNFSYDYIKTSEATLDANAETKSYNVAQIFGIVTLKKIHINVLTQFSSNIRNFYLSIYDGATDVPISASTGLTLDNAPVGSLITRIKDSSELLDYESGATCFIAENTNFREVQTEVICGSKGDGTATYLRLTYTTTDAPSSGKIRGHIEWDKITDDGFVELL